MRSAGPKSNTPAFIVVLTVLIGAGVSLQAAKHLTAAVLHKEKVLLRHPLRDLPRIVGRWQRLGDDLIISREEVEELGTNQYLTRRYAVDRDVRNGVLQLHIAYYTGIIDAVPHIPERCNVAGGLEKSAASFVMPLPIDTSGWQPDLSDIATSISGREEKAGDAYRIAQTRTGEAVRMPHLPQGGLRLNISEYWTPDAPERKLCAGYLFIANGKATPFAESVRLLAFRLSDTHAYYCKIQFTLQNPLRPVSPQELAEVATGFLNELLPEIMSCLPDWYEIQRSDQVGGAGESG